ncbi:MAG: nucleotidyltransferase family protein [Verrucomicrobiota bacterium]|nr:nucleotidyltransferase family protein [Verrucomicrobiota bacterium]
MRIAAVVLAAGASSRFGEAKQFARFCGEPLLARAIKAARGAGCAPICVVTGAQTVSVVDVRIVPNEQWARGIGTSIRAGVQQLPEECEAAILTTCDQPLVTAESLRRLIKVNARIAAAEYSGTVGIPAFFARSEFASLLALADDEGAKKLILAPHAARVPMPEAAADVDTPADLAQLERGHEV